MADPKNYDDADDPYRAIRVGDPGVTGEATKWGHLLTRFMRLMAIFWLLQGLMQWLAVLTAQKPIFDTMPQNAALAIIFFSVLDLIAGVGLWLATPWGGVLWLLIASAQIFVAASMPRFFVGGWRQSSADRAVFRAHLRSGMRFRGAKRHREAPKAESRHYYRDRRTGARAGFVAAHFARP